ncbi:MAG: hypothetical protein GC164_16345 [Phycisphaera sp.]|nr:hypothetical protein [Phycisphaera sp.]
MSKVRIAFLGCGGFMGAHANRIKGNPDAELVALCDVSDEQVQKFIDRHFTDTATKPAKYTDPAKMYAQSKPDAAFIATPHTLHFAHGKQALEAGCHVYMEKPMVTSLPDAYALRDTVKKTGKILVVGYNTPCSRELHYVRDAIRNRTFGKLELVTGQLSQGWMKATVGLWRQKPELSGGGQAYDSGAHLLNSLVWSVESNVDEVFAYVDNHGTPVDINSVMSIKFANGVLAAICVSGNCPANSGNMSFIFENGKIDVDGWGGSWMKVWDERGREVKYPHVTGKDQTPDDNFIDACLGRANPNTSVENGIIQSQLMDAIYESARTGQPARPAKK